MFPQPTTTSNPLQLEPDNRFDASRVRVIAHRAKTVWKAPRVRFPGSCVPPMVLENIPAGLHPPIVRLDAVLKIPVEEILLVFFVRPLHLDGISPATGCKLGWRKISTRPGQIVSHHPSTPHILSFDPIPPPELQSNERALHFLSGKQPEMCQLLPGLDAQSSPFVANKAGSPFSRPSKGNNHLLPRPLHVEVTQIAVGRSPSGWRDFHVRFWPKYSRKRLVIRR